MAHEVSTLDFVIGATISICSSAVSSLGVNIQASSLHNQRVLNSLSEEQEWDSELDINDLDTSTQQNTVPPSFWILLSVVVGRSEVLSTTQAWKLIWYGSQWYFGFAMYLVAQACGSVFALIFISPMILAPLGSLGLIFNILFSSAFLGTTITKRDWIATLLIVAGCALVSTFGSSIPESRKSLDELIDALTTPAFIAYSSVQVFLDLFIFSLIKYLEYRIDSLRDDLVRRSTVIVARRISRSESLNFTHGESNERMSGRNIKNRAVSVPSLVAFRQLNSLPPSEDEVEICQEPVPGDSETDSLLRPSVNHRAVKRGHLSALVGFLYAFLGGIIASDTLLLTKSGY